ncbi:MAG: NAD(P)H-quinone oxidoreductase [Chloroflexota bacterium]
MKAIIVQTQEKARPLRWETVDDPSITDDEVLVDVCATALNRADLMQRAGNYPPPPGASDILGLEMAGRIAALGKNVTGWQIGDRVCALLTGGGYAEKVAVPHEMLIPIPDTWSFQEAAAVPEVFLTAFVNLFMEANFQPGETVLVHGGASGVGTAAIQLIHHAGGTVYVTAGTTEKCEYCRQLGADLATNYREQDFVAAIHEHANGGVVDIILDMVGADYFSKNMKLLKNRGRLVHIATLSGAKTEVNLAALMIRRLRLIGSVLRGRSLQEKVDIKDAFLKQFWPAFEAGKIKPIIDSTFPIEEANIAQQRMAENKNIGKIILTIQN